MVIFYVGSRIIRKTIGSFTHGEPQTPCDLTSDMIPLLNKLLIRSNARIAEPRSIRHIIQNSFLFIVLFLFVDSIYGQIKETNVELGRDAVLKTIEAFKISNVSKSVSEFEAKMPAPIIDLRARQIIIKSLPAYVEKLRVNNTAVEEKLRSLLQPVLSLFEREKIYDIAIVRHETPLIFSDSGVVLVITTGALIEVKSEDELIGLIAHEIGHEYFAQHSIYTKHLLENITNEKETSLRDYLVKILLILELQCDAFAAISTAYLGYNPFAFLNWLERVANKFPEHSKGYHPKESVRRHVVSGILSRIFLRTFAKSSPMFLEMKVELKK